MREGDGVGGDKRQPFREASEGVEEFRARGEDVVTGMVAEDCLHRQVCEWAAG